MSKSRQERRISDSIYEVGTEFERTSKQYMRRLVPPGCLRTLDIGCGTGVNAKHLAALGHEVVGVDISAVAVGKLKAEDIAGIVADIAEGLPFADAAFDVVFASEVLEHLADTSAFLAETFRVLKPNGRLVLSTPNSSFWPFRILALFGQTLTEMQHPGHVRFFSKRSLGAACASAGFGDIEISARHMYMVLPDRMATLMAPVLQAAGFRREYRYATRKHFWQLSRFASRASGFWSDTLILRARK